jgi:O-glycosyl hydrolase
MKKLYLLLISISAFYYIPAQTLMTVDPATEYQTIIGMGGNGISTDANYLKYLFDYLGCSAYRHWIESHTCTDPYVTIANINSGNIPFKDLDATALSFFNTLKNKGVTVIATCWSPPACLKMNNCSQQLGNGVCCASCGTYNCVDDLNYILPDHYDEYARYLSLWAKDFQTKTGINLYAVSIQNEPLFNEPYNSAKLFPHAYGPSLQAVHDTFAKYPALSNIKFFGPEHMCNYGGNSGYIKSLIDTATYRPLLDIWAVHGYSDGIAPDLGSSGEWESFYNKMVVGNNKMLWMSETSGDFDVWADAYGYMKCMFMAFKSGKVSLWTYWGMQAFYATGTPKRQLYNHLHFYRFIRPGAKMIKVTDTDPDVEAIGFKNVSDYTLVVINVSKTASKTVQFSDFAGKPSFFQVYRSSSSEMCSYVGKVTDNTFQLPPESVVTITYNATSPNVIYGPQAPTNLAATKISDNSITVTWTPASSWTLSGSPVSISGYIVYINGVKKTMSPTTSSTYVFSGLKPNTKYTIEVFARDAMINQSVAATLDVTTTCVVGGCGPGPGIDEAQMALSVSPNPVCNILTVEMPDNSLYCVVMVDINGKTVVSRQNVSGKETIDVSNMAKGIYVVMAYSGVKIYRSKISVE